MLTNSVGDLARAYAMRSNTARLRSTLDVLTQEISSGEVKDLGLRLRGDTGILNSLEARLALTEQFQKNLKDAVVQTNEQQAALGTAHEVANKLATKILTSSLQASPSPLPSFVAEAEQALTDVVTRLNLEYGGQYLFAGLAVDQPPLISAAGIMDRLEELTADLATADEVTRAVSEWFDAEPGEGGFVDTAYKGTLDTARIFKVSRSRFVNLGASAVDPEVRTLLKGLALTALAGRGLAEGQHETKLAMVRKGGQIVFDNEPALTGYRAKIGIIQENLEIQDPENTASLSTLLRTRNQIRQVDPYETIAALSETQSQLEAVYKLTARLSKLSLTEYLR